MAEVVTPLLPLQFNEVTHRFGSTEFSPPFFEGTPLPPPPPLFCCPPPRTTALPFEAMIVQFFTFSLIYSRGREVRKSRLLQKEGVVNNALPRPIILALLMAIGCSTRTRGRQELDWRQPRTSMLLLSFSFRGRKNRESWRPAMAYYHYIALRYVYSP